MLATVRWPCPDHSSRATRQPAHGSKGRVDRDPTTNEWVTVLQLFLSVPLALPVCCSFVVCDSRRGGDGRSCGKPVSEAVGGGANGSEIFLRVDSGAGERRGGR